ARLQSEFPARLARLEIAGDPGEARHLLPRLDAQVEETRARLVLRRRLDRALPFEAEVAKLAAGLELERELAQVGGQRQRFGETRKRCELQRVGADHAAFRLPCELEVDRRERRAILRRQRERAC